MGIDEKDLEALVKLAHDIPHIGINLARVFWSNEMPKHTVELNSFYLDTHEVTNAQFKQFVQETRYEAQGKWQKYAGEDRANHPVVNVSWFDAKAYAEWSGKRLPNEAEWEYAARGGKDVKWWPWGNEEDPLKANYQRKRETFFTGIPRVIGVKKKINTKRVGNYEPNGYGLYDIIGNVEEWCEDEFKSYPGGPSIRPLRGEKPGPKKAIRGGSWITKHPAYMRITKRHRTRPDGFNYSLGFRCAKSMK